MSHLPEGAPASSASATASASAAGLTPITALPVAGHPTDAARQAYEQALASLRRAGWCRARELLDEAVKADPRFMEAQLRLAHIEGVFGELKQAREACLLAAMTARDELRGRRRHEGHRG